MSDFFVRNHSVITLIRKYYQIGQNPKKQRKFLVLAPDLKKVRKEFSNKNTRNQSEIRKIKEIKKLRKS